LSEIDVSREQANINQKIDGAQQRIADLENQLHLIDIDLEKLFQDRQQYILLSEISDRIDKLNKIGGACLFWGDDCDENESVAKYQRIHNLVINYDESVKEATKRRELIKEDIQSVIAQINILNDEILMVHERAEERQHEFVIEREMTVHPFRPMIMPWTVQGDDEKRLQTRDQLTEIPERLAKLMIKKEPPPPPPPKVEPKIKKTDSKDKKPKKEAPKPKTEKAKKARKVAESAGLLAFKENFADLMDNKAEQKLGSQARLSNKGQKARKITRSLVTAQAEGASGGINTASLSRNVGGTGKSIGGVEFSRVESAIGSDFFGEERPLSDGPGPSRTDEEIQIVFDRYKSALYRIYKSLPAVWSPVIWMHRH